MRCAFERNRGALMTGVALHHNVIRKMFAKEQDECRPQPGVSTGS